MSIFAITVLIGVIAGPRAMTAPAAVAWADGAEARRILAGAFGKYLPAVLVEDAVAILGGLRIVVPAA